MVADIFGHVLMTAYPTFLWGACSGTSCTTRWGSLFHSKLVSISNAAHSIGCIASDQEHIRTKSLLLKQNFIGAVSKSKCLKMRPSTPNIFVLKFKLHIESSTRNCTSKLCGLISLVQRNILIWNLSAVITTLQVVLQIWNSTWRFGCICTVWIRATKMIQINVFSRVKIIGSSYFELHKEIYLQELRDIKTIWK